MIRPGSAMTKAKQTKGATGAPMVSKAVEEKPLDAATFIKNRDWVGATTFLELEKSVTDTKHDNALWLAFCYFHNGEYQRAIKIYDDLLKKPDANKEWHIYKGCCHFALCSYDDAKRDVTKGPETPLQTRLLFHIAHKKNDEKSLMDCHHKLEETTSDQLCLGAIHYLRGHYEEAIDIYKKLLLENRDNLALNVYVALCYYKLDYYDVSLEILSSYLNTNPTSVMAVNLKACNQHQLYNGKAAEMELKVLQQNYETGNVFQDNDLLRHNLVVFRNGENAQQVLPPLLDVFPEARLNLILFHIKNDDVASAMELLKELEPSTPREYIIKAVVHAVLGQKTDSKEHVKTAQQLYQMIGISASECDTIPGRQCMASFFFLVKQFDDVLVYLKSIRQFFQNDDDFNWNFGIACASANEFNDAEEAFSLVQSEKLKSDYIYVSWYSRVLIMNGKPHQAWELYVNMENANESLSLLQVIANDCYRMGHFYYAAKAFDLLERMDQDPEHTEGKKGAVVGVFQMVIAGKEEPQHLVDVLNMMKNAGNNPQVEYMLKVIKKWGKENGLQIQ